MKLYKAALFLSLIAVMSMAASDPKLQKISFGAIVPETSLVTLQRAYKKKLTESVASLMKGRYTNLNLQNYFRITTPDLLSLSLAPSPTDLLSKLCDSLLPEGVAAILFFSEYNVYGRGTASIQYLLQLTGYLNIPVISWNAYNIGLKQRASDSRVLQLAPTVEHQSAAMLSILRRYSWHQFCIVTTPLAGHDDFIRSIRDQANDAENEFKYQILDIYVLKSKTVRDLIKEMKTLAESEARVILLFSLREEAEKIMFAAEDRGITGKNYVWIVTQSVVGEVLDRAPISFPRGMLGIHLNISKDRLMDEIENAVIIFGHGLELLVNDNRVTDYNLVPAMDCNVTGKMRWNRGDQFYSYLRNVSVSKSGSPPVEFNADGTLKYVELELVNLGNNRLWHKIGAWTKHGLVIKDIIWPGDSPAPPPGVPEKFNMKVTFMEEAPYVNMVPPDNETGECKTSRAVRCRVAKEAEMAGVNISLAIRNPKYFMCCSGFCIDLLEKFANDLKFTYELYRVEDGIWGILNNNTWNGLVREILNHKADVVVTSFKINSERQTAVDFTVPFMDTGIAIVVAKRTGIISPKAFLEPFDTMCWLMILLVTIQAAAIAIFIFEWLSPFGYDMKMRPPRDHKFSLFRTYWLVWAILFGASVNVDCPRGYTARFMSIVWAMFAVVFLAIYTANLAAFMITREEFHDLTGIEDKRLQNPMIIHPPFRFGTIPNGNTEAVMKLNKPELYRYMKKFDRKTVQDGIKAVKRGNLDAFIYDATVLEYLVSQDNECRLLTAGNWYAMTGYGFAFPKKSKYLDRFNKLMIKYRETGDIERLQRFWLQGVCKPNKHKRNASKPLDVNQFISAFLLLGCGVVFTLIILALEHLYFRSIRKHLARKDSRGYFALLSLSMGKSLTFRGAVYEAQDMLKHHRCKDPICDTQLWKARRQLDVANLKIMQLEAKLRERNNRPYLSDLTMNMVNANNAYHLYNPPRCLSYKGCNRHEIAEIETVL